MIIEIIIFVLTFLLVYTYYKYKKVHWYYESKGVKYDPGLPFFGNSFKSIANQVHIWKDVDKIYRKFPEEKYCGYIEGAAPVLIVRDPEIIKNITVKDFDYFVNRRNFFSEGDSLFGGSLLTLKDDKWRDMRSTLSPAFTSSKMRLMMPFMTQISAKIVEYLKEHLKTGSNIVNVDDIIRRYTNDVIASAAFGLEVNSLKDKENQFYKTGQELMRFTMWQNFMFFFMAQFPGLSNKLNLQLFSAKTINFFRNIMAETIDYRKKNKVERPDMIQLLMETSREWTQDEITGQAFIFFFAGFESSANALVMSIHEMALNPHVQGKLYQEIKSYAESETGITYENINDLKYLNCVINETSRKWSAALFLDRTCTKTYELPPSREGAKPTILQPGDIVYNMVNSIHMDPKYFPDPHVFDPERFNDENKHNIKPFTFMPFGEGPRNCIGSRFALLELKVLLYYFVLNFKIYKCDKTMDPIDIDTGIFVRVRGGTWVRLETRC